MVEVLKINPKNPDLILIQKAMNSIATGKLVIFPTDTVYGLATDPYNKKAVENLLKAKKRDPSKGLPILVGNLQLAHELVEFSIIAESLASQFWPGALTMVLPLRKMELKFVTGDRSSLGIRIPNNIVAKQLAKVPIIGTSANISGQDSPLTATDAISQLGTSIDIVLDCGPAQEGLPSTILDLTQDPPRLLREGSIKFSQLQKFLR